MEEQLLNLKEEAIALINKANSIDELNKLKIKFLGRKGELTAIIKNISKLPDKLKPGIGKLSNQIKNQLSQLIEDREKTLQKDEITDAIDITLPGRRPYIGKLNIITRALNKLCDIFTSMGFEIATGPEVETDYYNFTALNFPKDHPARDMQDTLYLEEGDLLLRTHTSPVQIRYMESNKPPIRMIAPGRVYRSDVIDASHLVMFMQIEGLLVDDRVRFTDLKGVLNESLSRYFEKPIKSRFRPSFFPFTEPSAEIDINCPHCDGEGCTTCGYDGWIEVLGAGMVDPAVLEAVGYDKDEFRGFAFGMGVERLIMIKHKINDMRLFYDNDLRFLESL
jgi:phenylalanyl-tRNA synthetase alpha chain